MGTISYTLKRAMAGTLGITGIPAIRIAGLARRGYLILTYHRVIAKERAGAWVEPGLYTEPDTFRRHMEYVSQRFDVKPLSDIVSSGPSSRPRCAITFDDGWADFFDCAYPVLRSLSVPATVFLPTDYIGSDRWLPTDILAYLIHTYIRRLEENPSAVFSSDDDDVSLLERTARARRSAGPCITLFKEMPGARREKIVSEWSQRLQVTVPRARAFMSWDEVVRIRNSGLVEFGSHGTSHNDFTRISPEDIRKELAGSRKTLLDRKAADEKRLTFSYPYGNCRADTPRIVEEEGYILAVTGRSGWNDHGSGRYTLKRISIHQDMGRDIGLFLCRIGCLL